LIYLDAALHLAILIHGANVVYAGTVPTFGAALENFVRQWVVALIQ
jgi:hypothetical protein